MKLGIIGYGIMGERLLRAALAHGQGIVTVAGVWDPAAAARDRLAADLPDVPCLASAEAVIAAAECVYVAAPPAAHLDHAERVLAAERALFCEKPLAIDPAAARALVERAEAGGARAAVNFPFASSFAVDQLRAWMADGAVGTPAAVDIKMAFATWPRGWQMDAASWLAKRAEGGFTREVGSHFLFLARRFFGPLALGSARAVFPEGKGSETAIQATLTAGAVPVTVDGAVGQTEQDDHNLWVVSGPEGAIRLRDWSIAERRGAAGAWHPAPDALPNEKIRPLVLKRQLQKVAAMTQGAPHDLATLREALEVQEMVEAILATGA